MESGNIRLLDEDRTIAGPPWFLDDEGITQGEQEQEQEQELILSLLDPSLVRRTYNIRRPRNRLATTHLDRDGLLEWLRSHGVLTRLRPTPHTDDEGTWQRVDSLAEPSMYDVDYPIDQLTQDVLDQLDQAGSASTTTAQALANAVTFLRYLLPAEILERPDPALAQGLTSERISELPRELTQGSSSGTGIRSLADALRQLLLRVLEPGQQHLMTAEFFMGWLAEHLPIDSEAFQQLIDADTIDVTGVLPIVTLLWQFRAAVYETRDDERGPLVHPVYGPARNQDDRETPIVHLLWRRARQPSGRTVDLLVPLFTAAYPVALRAQEPFGAGPETLSAAVRLLRDYQRIGRRISGLMTERRFADAAEITRSVNEIHDTWQSVYLQLTPQSGSVTTEILRAALARLSTLMERMEGRGAPGPSRTGR
jgi:hypothetical protein